MPLYAPSTLQAQCSTQKCITNHKLQPWNSFDSSTRFINNNNFKVSILSIFHFKDVFCQKDKGRDTSVPTSRPTTSPCSAIASPHPSPIRHRPWSPPRHRPWPPFLWNRVGWERWQQTLRINFNISNLKRKNNVQPTFHRLYFCNSTSNVCIIYKLYVYIRSSKRIQKVYV